MWNMISNYIEGIRCKRDVEKLEYKLKFLEDEEEIEATMDLINLRKTLKASDFYLFINKSSMK